jgi:peptide/nickel transport system substrate-binding protein
LQDIQVCEAIQSQIADVGIDASIETFEWAAYLQRTGLPVEENDVPMAMYGWATGTGDADYALFPLLHSSQHVPSGSNRSFYTNTTVDELLSDARTIADQDLREALYNQAIDTLWEDAPWLYLHVQGQLTGIRNEVENLVVYPTQGIWLKDASLSE